jgi:hypothetical protein
METTGGLEDRLERSIGYQSRPLFSNLASLPSPTINFTFLTGKRGREPLPK